MPAPAGGGLVKPGWFRRYLPAELPAFERMVQSWDTASKASELADFSVCTSWGFKERNLYLLDVLRAHLDYPDLKRAVREGYLRLKPDIVLIEDKASGTQLIQELVAEGLDAVTRDRPQADKVMRMHAQTVVPGLEPGVENGFVHLPQAAPGLPNTCTSFRCSRTGASTIRSIRRRSSSTGSSCRGARTASTPITACSPRSAAARRRPDRAD
jgi:hypothetical protein